MKHVFHGTYVGTGSALTIALGFVPDWVRIQNIDQAEQELLEWDIHFGRAATGAGGVVRSGLGSSGANFVALAANAGVALYSGGAVNSSSSASVLVPLGMAEAEFERDQRANNPAAPVLSFQLENAGNRTGKFNAAVDTTYVKVGSPVWIEGQKYFIVALTSTGAASNQVTLERAPTGHGTGNIAGHFRVNRLGYAYDLAPAKVGATLSPGIRILDTTYCNVATQVCALRCGTYE
jgi:hypothetical protein